jgi:23S rRNA pseudouridine1911/1915/1917 synthase
MQKDLSGQLQAVDFNIHPTYKPLPLRCDLYLKARFPTRSRNQLQKLFVERRILVNSRPVSASFKLRGGENVRVLLSENIDFIPPESVDLNIVHEEASFMAINKSPGIMMHPAGSVLSGTLLNAIHYYFEQQDDPNRPGLLQRLDKDTSGLLLVAKDNPAHQHLQDQILNHSLDKVYLAICEGTPTTPEGLIEAPIGEVDHPFFKKMGVDEQGKASKTGYCTLATWDHASLIGVRLYTGRQHQIRVHMAHIGHPLIGDELYGGNRTFPRQALHSYFCRLTHPQKNESMDLSADLPEDFQRYLQTQPQPHSIDHNVDMSCSARPWNPRTWLSKIRTV